MIRSFFRQRPRRYPKVWEEVEVSPGVFAGRTNWDAWHNNPDEEIKREAVEQIRKFAGLSPVPWEIMKELLRKYS